MIDHADAALEAWLGALEPSIEVSFDPPSDAGTGKRPAVSLMLRAVREKSAKRDTEVRDIRDTNGRVVGRQASTRFFELDYVCTVGGPQRDAHRTLGAIIQLLVDHDSIPPAHVPDELAAPGHSIDVTVVAPSGLDTARAGAAGAAAIGIRVLVPVVPTPVREIAPPAESLHLDMFPPPERRSPFAQQAPIVVAAEPDSEPLPSPLERKWTTVRRRELITKTAVANEEGTS